MANLTHLPVEIIEGIMDAAHPMPHGIIDSRHAEQRPAASTFGALRLVCRELNAKVFKRYVETMFSVHTVILEEPSLRALIDMGENEHFRNALSALFIDIREIVHDLPSSAPEEDRSWLQNIIDMRDPISVTTRLFQQVLPIFPNLREMTIEHTTVLGHCSASRMACLGASAVQKRLGRRASLGEQALNNQHLFRALFMGLATMKKELIDLQIRFVCRGEYARIGSEYIEWDHLAHRTHEAYLTTDFLKSLLQHSDYEGFDATLQGLTTLALPIRVPPSRDFGDIYGAPEDWPGEFEPTVLANFISLSPELQDLTVFFAAGDDQAMIDIKAAIPWNSLSNLWALELGGTQFEYNALVASLAVLKGTLRNLTLRHVKLNSKAEWISLIRFLHTKMDLTDFEIWEPSSADVPGYKSGLCFRNLKGKCYQPYRAWRVKKQLPEDLDRYLADLKETKMHKIRAPGCQFAGW
ncbi:hypothetical protein Vi05172_g13233 [Venturia inaequalis]|nr:hypothetical protein Vi05172_g13233 [Venturia inaequalis]